MFNCSACFLEQLGRKLGLGAPTWWVNDLFVWKLVQVGHYRILQRLLLGLKGSGTTKMFAAFTFIKFNKLVIDLITSFCCFLSDSTLTLKINVLNVAQCFLTIYSLSSAMFIHVLGRYRFFYCTGAVNLWNSCINQDPLCWSSVVCQWTTQRSHRYTL